ncbi:FkbM family methyltransferase [Nodularia sphaerocarpa]|uniref:FkbM family methyltransferase n=1 Tax=Nodularia sphaerocarpa TaxID=137816 RepID=UPI001EFBD4E6|nr:FkbM family methyltransferase [Nodularia sphaerocarpa]MDB9375006.1 FkbM family methyltransferase [Nodularia sphaerocarpa CS-585]MDB9377685.1 FkbM family methyltransferase [Nodularia sphaerocarpa CS-585A2]ULP74200.1 hypothetical protein BDGGKGIB_03863 [Nodularia sphaerocarpa UHCC 0038]
MTAINTQRFLKETAYLLHIIIAKSKLLSEIYIHILSKILKSIPDSRIKQQVLNSINSIEWKQLDLKAQSISIGTDIKFKIIPHLQEFDSQSLFSKKICYEAEVFDYLDKNIKDFDTIIEVGANVGIFTLYFYQSFLKYGKNIKIFAFEPSKEAYLRLLKNLHINEANSIQTYNCAVGDKTGFFDFFEPQGHLTNGSLNEEFAYLFSNKVSHNKALVIKGDYLSHMVGEGHTYGVRVASRKERSYRTLVKIDVEGAEFEVLSGMKEFILVQKPTLIIEILSTYEDKLNKLNFLHDNYDLYNLTEDGLIQHFKFESTKFRDYVLLPKQEAMR